MSITIASKIAIYSGINLTKEIKDCMLLKLEKRDGKSYE